MKNTLLKPIAKGILAATTMSFLFANNVKALTYTLHDEFSGAQQPVGSVTVNFTTVVAGTVDLTITAALVDQEFMTQLYLNLDPTLNPLSLAFAQLSSSGSFANATISKGVNAFKADGDGRYDILFDFSQGSPSTRFNKTDSVTYRITGIAGLVAEDFDFLSAPDGGNGPFTAAAKIQGIGEGANGSGWIAPGPNPSPVPDGGATLISLGVALVGLGTMRRFVKN